MSIREISFPSANGRDTIKAWSYSPLGKPKAIVQLIHGYGEHSRRYLHMISKFNEAGFVVFADDHLGHGKIRALLAAEQTKRSARKPGHRREEYGARRKNQAVFCHEAAGASVGAGVGVAIGIGDMFGSGVFSDASAGFCSTTSSSEMYQRVPLLIKCSL